MRVTGSELVGLVPLQVMLDTGRYYLKQQQRSVGRFVYLLRLARSRCTDRCVLVGRVHGCGDGTGAVAAARTRREHEAQLVVVVAQAVHLALESATQLHMIA